MTVETIKTRHRGKKQNQQQIHETISNNIYSRKIIIFYVENPKEGIYKKAHRTKK